MASWITVNLLFCEGPHDTAFLSRIFQSQLNFNKAKLKISELPYPLANVLKQSFASRASEDLRLDLAKKFFLPDYTLSNGNKLVLIFNFGGSTRAATMSPFLANVFALLSATPFSGLDGLTPPTYKYTIFADADAAGRANALKVLTDELSSIEGTPWLSNSWTRFKTTRAETQNTVVGSAAAYIWAKWTEEYGTLEDITLECLSDPKSLQKTLDFLDTRFDWKPPENAKPEQTYAIAAKRLKAAFCVEGQYLRPGASLGVILEQTDLLSVDALKNSAAVQDCVHFLRDWLASTQPITQAP